MPPEEGPLPPVPEDLAQVLRGSEVPWVFPVKLVDMKSCLAVKFVLEHKIPFFSDSILVVLS